MYRNGLEDWLRKEAIPFKRTKPFGGADQLLLPPPKGGASGGAGGAHKKPNQDEIIDVDIIPDKPIGGLSTPVTEQAGGLGWKGATGLAAGGVLGGTMIGSSFSSNNSPRVQN